MVNEDDYILEVLGISKHFGGVYALDNVDLQLRHNEILGLVGDNGAGKSTLIKIISGILKQDSGDIYFKGEKVNIENPKDASELGIETVYQDLSLVDPRNVPFNIFLGREIRYKGPLRIFGTLNDRFMLKESKDLLNKMNIIIMRK